MQRRQYLTTVAATAAALSVAGCSDSGGNGNGNGDDGTDTPDPVDEDAAQQHYDDAIAELSDNADQLDSWSEDGPQRDQETIDDLRSALSTVRDSLDEAEAVAPKDMMDTIEYARDVADLQDALIDFNEHALTFETEFDAAQTAMDNEQNGDAKTGFQAALDALSDAQDALDDAESAHGTLLDGSSVDEPDLDYSDDYLSYVELSSRGELTVMTEFVSGWSELNESFILLDDGFKSFDQGDPAAARQTFQDGETRLANADAHFQTVTTHEDTWQSVKQEATVMTDAVSTVEDAFAKFVQATHEAEAGNQQAAETLVQEGFQLLEQL